MKCEHCGKNEVAFIYRSNINGRVEEKRMCAACAERLGYSKRLEAHDRRMMRDFFTGGLWNDRLLEDFFAPTGRRWLLEDPFEDVFRAMPALQTAPKAEPQTAPQEELLEKEEREVFSRLRRLNALRVEKEKAVREEDFERAAQLRDQIRALEAEGGEERESA